jgi:hypothetical protein
MDVQRMDAAIEGLVRACADLDDLRASMTQRGLRYMCVSRKRRLEVSRKFDLGVAVIEGAVESLREIRDGRNSNAAFYDGLG